jgi:hypothetical protein
VGGGGAEAALTQAFLLVILEATDEVRPGASPQRRRGTGRADSPVVEEEGAGLLGDRLGGEAGPILVDRVWAIVATVAVGGASVAPFAPSTERLVVKIKRKSPEQMAEIRPFSGTASRGFRLSDSVH